MKDFHSVITEISEYFVTVGVLVIPPLFVSTRQASLLPVPALALIFYAAISIFLYLRAQRAQEQRIQITVLAKSVSKKFSLPVCTLLCFCALSCSAFILDRIGKVNSTTIPKPILPQTPRQLLLFFLGICILSCYEEILYRFFLPEKGRAIVALLCDKTVRIQGIYLRRIAYATAECIPAILFALSHRYLGNLAAAHALISAAILRLCLHKSENLIPPCIAHCLYNLSAMTVLYYSRATLF